MVQLTKLIKIVVMSVTTTFVSCQKTINMKALVLSTYGTGTNDVTINLDAYGIPYDVVEFTPTDVFTGNLELYNEDNEPKYSLIVVNGGGLYQEIDNNWISALSSSQWNYLEEYEIKNGVRRVVISEDSSINDFVTLYKTNEWGLTKSEQSLVIENTDEVKKIFSDAGIKFDAKLNVNEVYHTRVRITNNKITQPLLYAPSNGEEDAVVATITKYDNGREILSFFFRLGSWSTTGVLLSHLWVTWGTRSLYNGFRRVYFTPQIDDVFLSSELVDEKNGLLYNTNKYYRTTPNDYDKLAKFQKEIIKEMPKGSFFRSELAFNGNGILIGGNSANSIVIGTESKCESESCDIEYVIKPGTGESRWPRANYQFSQSQYNTMEKDKLFQYFKNNSTILKEFFWSSHTFTHENLDKVSKSDVDNEIRLNIEMAGLLGVKGKDYWSSASMVTPQISGLHSKDTLEKLMEYGITSATGDVSRKAITNTENPYLPFITTMESSNLEGFPVIPRTPTEIYYFCSTREESLYAYKEIFSGQKDSYTYNDLLKSESDRTVHLMLQLRHEAHQFHQANIRAYPKDGYSGESLLEEWTRSVVKKYNEYVEWPLISLKMDDQAEKFINRYKLEQCGTQSKIIIANDKIAGISISATKGDCTVPITLPKGVNPMALPADATTEQYGNDPLTVWVPIKKGETKTFKLNSSLNWRVEGSVVEVSSTIPATTTTTSITTTTTTTTSIEPNQYKCKSELLNIPCCPAIVKKVYYTDAYGDWSIDFTSKNWCGLTPFDVETCWSEKLGFPCCSGCKVGYVDKDGQWGYENGNWCGILPDICNKN